MLRKILCPFIIILFLFNFASLVYGDDVTVEITRIKFVYQDGSSEIREISPGVSITFYKNDTTYDYVHLGNFTDLRGRVITDINFYVGDGWLEEGGVSTEDLNDTDIYNVLGNNTIDLGQYGTITTKCYYDGNVWPPTTPGSEPTPSPEPEPDPDPEPTPNSPPSVNQLTANPGSITYPETSEISFNVSDSDGDDISWTASISGGPDEGSLSSSSGTVSGGSGSVVITYTPQNTDGSFTIHIHLDDGHGNTASDSVVVTVTSVAVNNPPEISNLSADPNSIQKKPHKSNITFDVNDSNGDDVTWTATITAGPSPRGNITPSSGTVHSGSGSVSTKYQPVGKTPDGIFTIVIELDDGNGGTDTDSIDIELDRD